MANKLEVSLSSKTIYTLLFIAIGIFLVWQLSDIIILTITAMMCAAALAPAVDWLHSKKIPVVAAALMVVIVLVLPIIYILVSVLPTFVTQFPTIMDTISKSLNSYNFLPAEIRNLDLAQYFQNNTSSIWESTSKVTSFFFQIITLIFMIFYMLVDGNRLHELVASIIPGKDRKKLEKISNDLAKISGQYIRGNLLISLICSLVTLAGLMILQIPYAVPLALFAGVMDLLPLIGSTIGAIPSVIIAFTVSPLKGLLVIILFVVYQEVENDILSPSIYKQVLNLIPFLSFIAVIIGSLLFGIAGAFLALPVAAGVPTILNYLKTKKK